MKIRAVIAVIACKFTKFVLRLMKKGGTTLPGKVAVKICPNLLEILAKDVTTIIVTGTNGKTTTSRMIEQCLVEMGYDYFCNKSGANLLTGITNEFCLNSSIWAKCKKKYAIIECDEGAIKQVGKLSDPKFIVITNVFRDQLDRFGEISFTLESIKTGVKNSPNATVCINADCSLTRSIADDIDNKVVFYGVNTPVYEELVSEISDAQYCIKCNTEYEYEYKTYGHLGKYKCPKCGYERPNPQVAVTEIVESTVDSTLVKINLDGNVYDLCINLPGGYNVYNAVSCAAVAKSMGIDDRKIISALESFECGFGRMENFDIGGKNVRMILIKNPAGCNQVLNFLTNTVKKPCTFVIILNDKIADGTDISWIWDANFEKLEDLGENLDMVYVSGMRAYDMAARLKYAERNGDKFKVIEDQDELLEIIDKEDKDVFLMPTYSGMMSFREKISSRYGLKNYWEE